MKGKNDSIDVLIVTEANEKVASGHLFECITIYEELCDREVRARLLLNGDMPEMWKKLLPKDPLWYRSDIQNEVDNLILYIRNYSPRCVVFNLRDVREEFVAEIKKSDLGEIRYISIDEFGHKNLDVDVIFNPMIDDSYWEYKGDMSSLFCGHQYLVLPRSLYEYHKRDKHINKSIKNVVASMGGVDYYGTTLKIIDWLVKKRQDIYFEIVLGGGFRFNDELNEAISDFNNVRIHQNINYIYDLFYEADIAFCAGGNTLHELAAIGVPTIVIPTMKHEVRNAEAFENKGYAKTCPITTEVVEDDVMRMFENMASYNVRSQISITGKSIADGLGYARVCDVIREMI